MFCDLAWEQPWSWYLPRVVTLYQAQPFRLRIENVLSLGNDVPTSYLTEHLKARKLQSFLFEELEVGDYGGLNMRLFPSSYIAGKVF